MRFISFLPLAALVLAGCGRTGARVSAPAGVASACLATVPLVPGTPMRGSTLFGRDALMAS